MASERSKEACTLRRGIQVKEKAGKIPKHTKKTQKSISNKHKILFRKVAAILETIMYIAYRIVQYDLKCRSYVIQIKQVRSEDSNKRRPTLCMACMYVQ